MADVDLRPIVGVGHLVERGAAAVRALGAFLDGQEGLERGFAVGFQLGIGPGAVLEPELGIVAVALAVGQPVLGGLAQHAAVRHRHAEYDLGHLCVSLTQRGLGLRPGFANSFRVER
jgi:hypothetical protein